MKNWELIQQGTISFEKNGCINDHKFREKVLAKLKLKPGPELSPGVEKDDQLWSTLKR